MVRGKGGLLGPAALPVDLAESHESGDRRGDLRLQHVLKPADMGTAREGRRIKHIYYLDHFGRVPMSVRHF